MSDFQDLVGHRSFRALFKLFLIHIKDLTIASLQVTLPCRNFDYFVKVFFSVKS